MPESRKRREIVITSISFDKAVLAAVDEYAREQKRTRSSLINYLCFQSFLMAGDKPPADIPDNEEGQP